MKQVADFTLVEKECYGNAVLLRFRGSQALPDIAPGQFVQVRVDDSPTTYLRRPISIHDVNRDDNTVSLLVQMVGEGTRHLGAAKVGDTINLVLPLGKGYTLPAEGEKVLLVGGGIGIAPLYYLAKCVALKGVKPVFLLGGKKASDLVQLDAFRRVGETLVTTEDGSLGEKGMVTMHSVWEECQFDKIYVCGPKRMMMAVADIAKKDNVWCEVSLEHTMACGIGACLCCVEDTVEGNLCVCKEGPVFNTRRLKW